MSELEETLGNTKSNPLIWQGMKLRPRKEKLVDIFPKASKQAASSSIPHTIPPEE